MIDTINNITGKEDFIRFLQLLAEDYKKDSAHWENQTIPGYLEQIAAWVEDYSTSPANDIAWNQLEYKILAKIFYMGKLYE